jgi:hypothetical protein
MTKEEIIEKLGETDNVIVMSVLMGRLCRAIEDDKELVETIRYLFASDTLYGPIEL